MGEQTQTPETQDQPQTPTPPQPIVPPDPIPTPFLTSITITTTTITNNKLKPSPTPQSTSSSTPQTSTSTSKIPFRPRKVRKLSTNPSTKPSQATNQIIAPIIITRPLSYQGEIEKAIRHLRKSDPLLAPIIDFHHPPTFDSFHPPFLALTKSILYQQLAFKAGTAIYTRFISLCGGEAGVVPEAILGLSTLQLRQIGVSARKTSYLHDLANKFRTGILSDTSIVAMDDKSLFTMLTMVKGIGPWSVHMFMIFSLHRPDVLPIGDLGVRKGVQFLYGLEQLPRPSQMDQLCEKWRPYRSVASWYMWRFAEAKGASAITVEGEAGASQQQEGQAQQLLEEINGITSLG